MRRRFLLTLAAAVAAGACFDITGSSLGTLFVTPILDSVFVGDSLPARSVTLIDPAGRQVNPGPVTWTSDSVAVLTVNSATGEIHGVSKGQTRVTATASGATAKAQIVVSRPLDLTLLMDTAYLMPGDTFTIPLAVARKTTAPDTIRFDASANPAVYTIDTVTGLVTAQATPGAARYVAHVRNGSASVADTGAVVVMTLADTSRGKFFLTAVGANTRHEGGAARAVNYLRSDGLIAFLLADSSGSNTSLETFVLVRPESISAPGAYGIDTINPGEAATRRPSVVCTPPRVWAIWSSFAAGVAAYSRPVTLGNLAGTFSVTQRVAVTGGYAISGRYALTAQRGDFYFDPHGIVVIHGTFVAPLVLSQTACVP